MNRLKVWLFALLAVAVAAFLLRAHSSGLRADALAQVDARLAAGGAQGEASLREAQRLAGALAALAARDPALASALAPPAEPEPVARPPRTPPPPADPAARDAALARAATEALLGAASALGLRAVPEGALAAAGDRAWVARRAAAGALAPAAAGVQTALAGAPARGLVRAGPSIYAAASAAAGDGAAVAVLVPIAGAFARDLAAVSRVDVTLAAPEAPLVTTARPADAPGLVEAARGSPGQAVGAGALAKVDVSAPPLELRGLPPLFTAPAQRARATALEGVEGGLLVLSAPTAAALAPIAEFEWRAIAALALVLVLGLLFGALVRPSEILPSVPDALVAAAARIERGEFDARAPQLAGKLGTVADALNRAAAAAAAAPAAPAPAALRPDPFAPSSPQTLEPSAFEFPSRAAPAPAGRAPPAGQVDGAGLDGGAFEAAPVPARAEPEPQPAWEPPPEPVFAPAPRPAANATPPGLLEEAERAAPADPTVDEEGHWRQIFDDFLRVRAECGEPAQGLPFERFRQKLQANKATLVAKYGCRTVRFQVYVKEGKTALKATPVR